MPVQQGQAAKFEIVLERRRQVSDKLRGDEGHEARSIAVLCNKEGVEIHQLVDSVSWGFFY